LPKQIKILMYIPTLKGGGAERVFVNLANYFANNNIEVHLYVYNTGSYESLLDDKVIFYKKDSKNTFLRRVWLSFFGLMKCLKSTKPDYLFTTLDEANVIGYLALKLTFNKQVKHIVRQANVLDTDKLNEKGTKDKIFNYFNKISFKHSDLIIANSYDTLSSVKEKYSINQKIIFIPNPFDFKGVEIENSNDNFLFSNEKKYILLVGSLTDQKDHFTALKAFKKALEMNPNLQLIILGEGGLRKTLENKILQLDIAQQVHLLGFVNNPYFYYKNSSLFLLSSKYEGFGNVLVEALYFGIPIVSTNCSGGPTYILENGKYGSLVPVGDFKSMAVKIVEELKNDTPQLKLKRFERSKDFSIEKIGKEYLTQILNT